MKPRILMPLFTLLGALFMFASAYAAPSASCVLYVENYTAINMADGGGLVFEIQPTSQVKS